MSEWEAIERGLPITSETGHSSGYFADTVRKLAQRMQAADDVGDLDELRKACGELCQEVGVEWEPEDSWSVDDILAREG